MPKSKIQSLLRETTTTSATTKPYTTQYPTVSPTQETLTPQPTTMPPTPTTKATTATPKSTTKSTTTSTERSTTVTTSMTTKVEVTTPPVPQCYTCDRVNCTDGDLQECNTGTEFCMNTLKQGGDGSRTITRRYVSIKCGGQEKLCIWFVVLLAHHGNQNLFM